ncbi:alpha/beta hydrolase [Actinomadura sp. 1N219]|uniref:alpha/beta hydrolase n=1 Tax=Actinomadura sp. 1N219 TaxID=3375152 RepID=UPI00378EF4F0
MPRKRQWAAALIAVCTAGAMLAAPARADTADTIVDLPVQFTVRNENRTPVRCQADGKTYTIRGHLTAPASALRDDGAVTLYFHGIAEGEWYWRLGVPGYDHSREMAERGHASVTIDRLGYDSSDKPNGFDSCIGAQGDIAHQIVQQLRRGSYKATGRDDAPRFERVAVAGHSNGGQVAQIAAYTFGDVDGVVLMGWTDLGLTQQAMQRFLTSSQKCAQGGEPAERGGDPPGYVHYDVGEAEFVLGNFHDTDRRVIDAAVPLQNRHPCGDMGSQISGLFADGTRLDEIKAPVLLVYGAEDSRVQGGAAHAGRLTAAESVEVLNVPDAGHFMNVERNAPMVHDRLAAWLNRHELG